MEEGLEDQDNTDTGMTTSAELNYSMQVNSFRFWKITEFLIFFCCSFLTHNFEI